MITKLMTTLNIDSPLVCLPCLVTVYLKLQYDVPASDYYGFCIYFLYLAQQSPLGQGLLIHEVS